jgi:ubiquitin thioesterase OTU1
MEIHKPIRRCVDADNSCLFTSIAYLTDKSNFNESSSLYYRNMIVEYLINNEFDESLLDLPKNEYISDIGNPSKWGGGIEIKIFSEIFKIQIAVVDVQTNRIDLFGQDNNYENTIYILYNGIHYDPLVMNYDELNNIDNDITIFKSDNINVMNTFKDFAKEFNQKNEFVDLSKVILLECVDCKKHFNSKKDATKHAHDENHWNFGRI